MSARAVVVVAALAAALPSGCTKSRTEAVVVVTTSGMRVPDDIDVIQVLVFDATQGGTPLFDNRYILCDAQPASGCIRLPLLLTLIPGVEHPEDSTRVRVLAERQRRDRVDDAAVFTFSRGRSQRLDFILYAECLDRVDCGPRDLACAADGTCQTIDKVSLSGEPDLGSGPDDLGAADLAGGPVTGPDLAQRDLAPGPDFAGCTGSCVPQTCNTSDGCGNPCLCSAGQVCSGTSCVACGNTVNALCCEGNTCPYLAGLVCNSGTGLCDCGTSDPDAGSGCTLTPTDM